MPSEASLLLRFDMANCVTLTRRGFLIGLSTLGLPTSGAVAFQATTLSKVGHDHGHSSGFDDGYEDGLTATSRTHKVPAWLAQNRRPGNYADAFFKAYPLGYRAGWDKGIRASSDAAAQSTRDFPALLT
jgi:hypothetical protein